MIRTLIERSGHLWGEFKERDGLSGLIRKLFDLYRQRGLAGLRWGLHRVRSIAAEDLGRVTRNNYLAWLQAYEHHDDVKIEEQPQPLISVVMPVFNPNLQWLKEAVASVQNQQYTNWELCIADDCSTDADVKAYLGQKAKEDRRIRVVFRPVNGHISEASNSALRLASGDWVALLDQDDLLSQDALLYVIEAIQRHPEACLIYSDEDKLDKRGQRFGPYFKPDWNRYLFYSQNVISHIGVYKRSMVEAVGGFRKGLEGAQDYDLALRCIEQLQAKNIVHIPRILYHWRAHPKSTASRLDVKWYAREAGQRAISEHLARIGVDAEVMIIAAGYRVRYALPTPAPRVSVVIPTRNRLNYLRPCVESIISRTDYPNWELVIVDNGSDDPECLTYLQSLGQINPKTRITVVRDDGPFNFSALSNLGVAHAHGDIIALVNNDVEVIETDWLREMVSLACQPDVGAVGAKLLYPDGTVQHGGVILGMGGVAGHAHIGMACNEPGYGGRLALINEFSAMTAACLVIRRTLYEAVGGFDSRNLRVALNDVDFCLKVRELGYRNVFTPNAMLYHHESLSRGLDDTPEKLSRSNAEIRHLVAKWPNYIAYDPCCNPNLTLNSTDFSLAWPPRRPDPIGESRTLTDHDQER